MMSHRKRSFLLAIALAVLGGFTTTISAAQTVEDRPSTRIELSVADLMLERRDSEISLVGALPPHMENDELVLVIEGPRDALYVDGLHALDIGSARFDDAPLYHLVASTAPLERVTRTGRGPDPLWNVKQTLPVEHHVPATRYTEVLRDRMEQNRLYQTRVDLAGDVFSRAQGGIVRARLRLPPGAPYGEYQARLYAMRGGEEVGLGDTTFRIYRANLTSLADVHSDGDPRLAILGLLILFLYGGGLALIARITIGERLFR